MVFNSLVYALFLPAVVALHWSVRPGGRRWVLLVASYLFYAAWDWRFLGLIFLSTAVDFTIGRALAPERTERTRKGLLVTSVVTNLGILAVFKYCGFFIESAAALLARVGLEPNPALLQIVLPVGISFYTFQTICYTVRRLPPASSSPSATCVDFALFVAFFPQLVAGPIERADQPAAPARAPSAPARCRRRSAPALALILLGLFKKVVIADALAPIVEPRLRRPRQPLDGSRPGRRVAFALQIYGDFSGYTDIARGTSRLLGVELTRQLPPALPVPQPHRVLATGGTSRCRPGCATTCTSRSAATAADAGRPTGT